jgi:nicotinamide-nucleotide amidase
VATGGRGPPADDLTRDILAGLSGRRLVLREEALEAIQRRFSLRGMEMPESNRLQAMFPEGSRMIPNPEGTAPGIDIDLAEGDRRSRLFALPGVPSEMKRMWAETVRPAILAMRPEAGTIRFRVLRCFGAGESAIEAMLPDLIRRGRDPLVGITAHEATITLRIAARGRDDADCLARIAPVEETIRRCLGPLVFGVDDAEIEDAALAALAGAGQTLATTEGATCGLVAAMASAAERRASVGGLYRGGTVVAGRRPCPPDSERPEDGESLAAEAIACRERFGATLGLAIGEPRPDPDGAEVVSMVLVGPTGFAEGLGAVRIEHRLAGAGSLRVARAAKAALDLVRLTCLARPGSG